MTTTLDAYFDVPTPAAPAFTSAPVKVRDSIFVAFATPCTSERAAKQFQAQVRALRTQAHPDEASHEMLGWRIVGLRKGASGMNPDRDFEVQQGGDDDGEKGGAAAIRTAMARQNALDMAVVVSRYFGGSMLGPARFSHIETVTTDVVRQHAAHTVKLALVEQLNDLDLDIALRTGKPTTTPDYGKMDADKLGKLVGARQKRIEFLDSH